MGLAWLYYILCKTLHSKHTSKGVTNFEGMYVCMTRESSKMEQTLNFQVPAEGLELEILIHTQY